MADPDDIRHPRGRAFLDGVNRVRAWAARVNRTDSVVEAARSARKVAPGDLPILEVSSNPTRNSDRIARLIGEAGSAQPTALRELGLTAVQLWQALVARRPAVSEPSEYVTILFTDLVGFSTWALRAGDDKVLTLLRQVNAATTDVVTRRNGRVVKSLGDGVMAVFVDGADAIEAAHEAGLAVSAITIDGYRPALRAGLHTGKPRRDGDDYLGVDVNIAARVADAASGGEVLATSSTLDVTDADKYIKRRRRFRAKGAPKDLIVYAVVPKYDSGP
ncbi:adenylate/guanylate cyclase domain-containing protein [Williamsia phyllosphaerae]|uniref:Adenylate/guanylate cyclase domain-containing protein n=1 Tax=Williamsia phyllosphaerae TaxID=885042 RepID=A0ABQ1V9V2_9NOCA|nr:adenylate/guanylate cyclase domain-containing protein [Williamsia phyllosphaerae]GGF42823.1 adenylate/guanylate cyclase domain-containing protein [Williamsia phyllosphaerae]